MRDPPGRRRATLLPALLALLLLAATAAPAGAVDVLAASKLEACVADGGGGEGASSAAAATMPPPLACSQKLVLTVSVDASDAASSSSSRVELSVSCVGSPTGACPCPCDYARDEGCGCRDLEGGSALALTFAKTPVYAAYPLTYLQSFNWRPTEQIIRPQSSKCRVRQWRCWSVRWRDRDRRGPSATAEPRGPRKSRRAPRLPRRPVALARVRPQIAIKAKKHAHSPSLALSLSHLLGAPIPRKKPHRTATSTAAPPAGGTSSPASAPPGPRASAASAARSRCWAPR